MASSRDVMVERPADVTASWLTTSICSGLESISNFEYDRIGSGQMSECYRFKLLYAKTNTEDVNRPASTILKVASEDQSSRRSGNSMGLYQREVQFYQEIAPQLGNAVPQAYHASHDATAPSFALLLSDASPAQCGDDIQGASLEQARSCAHVLGEIHGKVFQKGLDAHPWLQRESVLNQGLFQSLFDGFVGRYREVLTAEQFSICARFVSCFDAYQLEQKQNRILGMIHGDYRLDNILFSGDASKITVVDWQTVSWAPILGDLAYFLGGSLTTELRRSHFDELVKIYHNALGGDRVLTTDRCLLELRHQSFFGLAMGICSSMLVQQTPRGDLMFATMIRRHCDLVIDLNAVELLPQPVELAVLQPLPEDEGVHPQGNEPMYNESYYFDFVDQTQGIAGYIRLGITPNSKDGGWYTAVLSRRGKPMVSVTDFAAPLADSSLRIQGKEYEAGHSVVKPLQNFLISFKGKGAVYGNPASIFKGEREDENVDLAFNLNFATDGTPYKYRITTRYEIPCLIDGTVNIGNETFTISRQVGQRDHSWGVRNWWNMDWLWSALHFEDGTHLHLIDLYIVGQSPLGVGYYQEPGKDMRELRSITTKWDIDPTSNLMRGSTLHFNADGASQRTVTVESIGHGPLRLVSDDGKVAFFDRAWCKCTLDDNRVGYGWVEWNRVQGADL